MSPSDDRLRSKLAASRPGLVAQIQLQGETRALCANISFVTVATLSATETAFGVMVTR
jgi:hypothetical protein